MRFQGSARVAFIVAIGAVPLATLGALGCSATDGSPLGGPYGGTTVVPPPDAAPTISAAKANRCKTSGLAAGDGTPTTGVQVAGDSGSPGDGGDAPTWTQVYGRYLQGCTGPGCHVEMTTSNGAYAWLVSQGYINGTSSNLANPLKSCLKWYGGDMPPCGGDDALAVADMNAWVAAGASNN